jgi:hypothetical protein
MELEQHSDSAVHHPVHFLTGISQATSFFFGELVEGNLLFTREEVQVNLFDIRFCVKLGVHPSAERRVGNHIFRSERCVVVSNLHVNLVNGGDNENG